MKMHQEESTILKPTQSNPGLLSRGGSSMNQLMSKQSAISVGSFMRPITPSVNQRNPQSGYVLTLPQ